MTTAMNTTPARDPRWRFLIWGLPAALPALPAAAMHLAVDGVHWTAGDFVVMGVLLGLTAGAIDLATARAGQLAHRMAGVAVAVGLFLLVWINLAVGMIGDEGHPANWLFAGVIAVIVGGAIVTRLRPAGMAATMLAAAVLQAAIGGAALVLRWGSEGRGWPLDVIGTTGLFTLIWLMCAVLFRRSRA